MLLKLFGTELAIRNRVSAVPTARGHVVDNAAVQWMVQRHMIDEDLLAGSQHQGG
jgi:hypothetical protein